MYPAYIFCYAPLVALAVSSSFTPPDILWLDENEVCKKSIFPEMTHVCKTLYDCKTAIQDIRDNVKYPTICSFKGKTPVVCCAPDGMSREQRLAEAAEDAHDTLPGLTLHFDSSYKDGLIQENLITYSRPRRRILSRNP